MKKFICTLVATILIISSLLPVGSAAASKESDYNGKIISVLGDSISTYAGYIPTSDGYNLEHLARYPQDNLFSGVEHTWWMQVIERLGAKLGVNDSWRGTTVDGKNATDKTAISNVQRIKNLGANGSPDVILLYGATNDYGQLNNIDTFDKSKIPAEVDLKTMQWKSLSKAFVNTIMRLQYFYPDAQIVVILPARTKSYYPMSKLHSGNKLLISICEHFGLPYVDLRTCGITNDHLPDGIHPNKVGMDLITEAVMKVMLEQCTITAGKTNVFTLKHNLTGVRASMKYYKSVREGGSFTETLSASTEGIEVTITMGGTDITASCYKNRTINIENVTGDIVITAKGTNTPDTTVADTTAPDTTVPDTTVPDTTVADTTDTTVADTTAAQNSGCGSAVAFALIPALAVAGALAVKRKKN